MPLFVVAVTFIGSVVLIAECSVWETVGVWLVVAHGCAGMIILGSLADGNFILPVISVLRSTVATNASIGNSD